MLTQTDSNLQLNIPYLRKLPTIPPSRPSPLVRAGKIAISVYSVILHFSRCDTVEPRYFEVPREMKKSSK